jgi:hypothetical protein
MQLVLATEYIPWAHRLLLENGERPDDPRHPSVQSPALVLQAGSHTTCSVHIKVMKARGYPQMQSVLGADALGGAAYVVMAGHVRGLRAPNCRECKRDAGNGEECGEGRESHGVLA